MSFVDKIKKAFNGKKQEVGSSDNRDTVYTPIDAAPEQAQQAVLTSSASLDPKKFNVLLDQFKENPSQDTLKPLEQFMGNSLNKSKIQHAIKDLPESKCSADVRQSLNKQLSDAIVALATQPTR